MDTQKKRIVAVAVIAGLFLAGTGTVFASNDSLPGDGLYPIKRALERAEVTLALSDDSKAKAEFEHASERLREVETLRERVASSMEEAERVELRERVRTAGDDTSMELEQAFMTLSRVHTSLSEKGNTQAALAIEDNINRLVDDTRNARFEVRIENEGDVERVRVRLSDDDSDDDLSDDSQGRGRGSDDATASTISASGVGTPDVRERASEVFCRGEWRDPEDCDDDRAGDDSSSSNSSSSSSSDDSDDSSSSSSSSSSNSSSSSSNSASGVGAPDVRERASEVFCRGEWRDPADCRGEPITTPPAGTTNAPAPSTGGVQGMDDVKENPTQILCDGEWRDPEDCARR